MRRQLFLFFIIFISQNVSALTYSWKYDYVNYPSAQSACDAAYAKMEATGSSGGMFVIKDRALRIVVVSGQTKGECGGQWYYSPSSGLSGVGPYSYQWTHGTSIRSGDSCPPGQTYNAVKGICEAPLPDPCLANTGTIIHEHRIGDLGTKVHSEPPISICQNACQYSNTFETTDCYRYVDSNPNSAFCSYKYKGNGVSCTPTATNPSVFNQPPTKPPSDTEPTRTDEQSCDNWVTAADGTKTRTCSDSDIYKQPGNMTCGKSQAATLDCSPSTPPPALTDNEVTTETKETVNADGSKTTVTTTTTTKTGCYGSKSCTTTSTTTTTTQGTAPDGTPGDSTSTCTGANCSQADDGTDMSEDPEEPAQGEGESPTVSPIVGPTTTGTFDDSVIEWDAKIADLQDQLEVKVKNLGDSFGGNLNLSTSGSLYCGDSVVVLGRTISFCLNEYSDELNPIALLVLFAGALVALFIVFR